MSSLDHILLYLILIGVFYVFSKNNRRYSDDVFWARALVPIIVYSLIEGCRYGRGVDYLSYKDRFEHIIPSEEPQILFLWLMQLLKSLDFNYVCVFIIYSFLTITGTFFMLKNVYDKNVRSWMFFLAFFAITFYAEMMVRQYVAQPFIFCAIPFLFAIKDIWKAFILFLIAINIHTGVAIQIPILIVSYYFITKTFSWKVWGLMLFFVYFILPQGLLVGVGINFLSFAFVGDLSASDHVMYYVEDSDRWLGEDSVIEYAEQTLVTKFLQFIFEFAIIYISCKVLEKIPNKKVMFTFNIAVVGFIMCRSFHGYEIFTRLFHQLYIYWFIPAGYAMYHILYNKKMFNLTNRKRLKFSMYAMLAYQFMFWFRFIFLNPKATFFWSV